MSSKLSEMFLSCNIKFPVVSIHGTDMYKSLQTNRQTLRLRAATQGVSIYVEVDTKIMHLDELVLHLLIKKYNPRSYYYTCILFMFQTAG